MLELIKRTICVISLLMLFSCSGILDYKDSVTIRDQVVGYYYIDAGVDSTVIQGNKYDYYVIWIHDARIGDDITVFDSSGTAYIQLEHWNYKQKLERKVKR